MVEVTDAELDRLVERNNRYIASLRARIAELENHK